MKTYKNYGGNDWVVFGNALQVQRTWPLNGTGPEDLRQSGIEWHRAGGTCAKVWYRSGGLPKMVKKIAVWFGAGP